MSNSNNSSDSYSYGATTGDSTMSVTLDFFGSLLQKVVMLEQLCQMESALRDKLQQQLNDTTSLTATLYTQVVSLSKTTETQASLIQQLMSQQKQLEEKRCACMSGGTRCDPDNGINRCNTNNNPIGKKRKAGEHPHQFDDGRDRSSLSQSTLLPSLSPLLHTLAASAVESAERDTNSRDNGTKAEVVRHEITIECASNSNNNSKTNNDYKNHYHRNSFVAAAAGSESEEEDTDIDDSDMEDTQGSPFPEKDEVKRKVHTWDERFAQLMQFYKKHGHYRVPTKPDGGFYHWVYEQRRAKDSMPAHQKKQLDDAGFSWELLVRNNREEIPAKWGKCFVQLQEFVQKNGHCQIPTDTNLYKWLYKQRNNRKKGMINKKQEEMLSSLGFNWENSRQQ